MAEGRKPVDEAEAEANRIVRAKDFDASGFIWKGVKERRLSRVIRGLNIMTLKKRTASLARRALRRLGFPVE